MKKTFLKLSSVIMILLLVSGCSLPGLASPTKKTVNIGTMTTSESEIMGYMLSMMIERETDLDTQMVPDLGSSIIQHQGMMRGDLDISSTRYSGTDISGALGMDPITDPEKVMNILKREFPKQFDQYWGDSYGFENSYAVTVTKEFAEENDIDTVSDLEPYVDDLRFGVDNAWINREGDGYDGFQEVYFSFGSIFPMNSGLVYKAAANGHMDVVLSNSSDGRIKAFELKVLEDDENFFPPYDTSPVIQNELLEEYPELKDITKRLAGTISTEQMQELNYEADVNLSSPKKVAEDFLKEHDYFEDKKEGN